jgi:Rad3-related DNA helicase
MTNEQIEQQVRRLTEKKFGKDFVFRPGQLEAIVDILSSYLNSEVTTYILEAPTGSGKILIAMICSAFLEEMNLRGYILTSELALQDQYIGDFRKYGLNWGSIKGADTYTCAVNMLPFSLGECRIQKLSYEQAEQLPCWEECGYLTNRKRAIESPVSLLNYSYALIQRNYVEEQQQKQGHGVPFPSRDFVFCDEAHRIIDIVQSHFSPRINQEFVDAIKYLETFQKKNGYGGEVLSANLISLVFLIQEEENKNIIKGHLQKFYNYLVKQRYKDKMVAEDAAKKFQDWNAVPSDWRRALAYMDRVKDVYCKVEDYLKILENSSTEKMVKTVNQTLKDTPEIIFNYVDEGYMVDRYFSKKFGFKVLMSATFGNPKYFLKAFGGKNARFNRIKSTFDFAKSPIYLMYKNRLSYRNIEEKTPLLAESLCSILDRHPDLSGIVHSGSYSLAKKVWNLLPKAHQDRIHLYEGTQEKINAISKIVGESSKKVVMGPSLLEGLDLKDDHSRLQVFLKVPYPSLANNFVKEKMKHYPDWYRWRACVSVLQGVGRSVRSQEDWAITYFLDGCLQDIIGEKHSVPEDFLNRIIRVERV